MTTPAGTTSTKSASPQPQQMAVVTPEQRQVAIQRQEDERLNFSKIKAYAKNQEIIERLTITLGSESNARIFVEAVIIAVANSEDLQKCSPKSIMISAMRAANLGLSVDPIMQQAHLVGFAGVCTLIPDYHGLVMMSENTGYYRVPPNVFEVFAGEKVEEDRFSGRITITGNPTEPKTGIGWCGYFQAINGTERWLYMTNEQCDAWGERYNPGAFHSKKSPWGTERPKMRRKTVLRTLVKRWGRFSNKAEVILKQLESEEAGTFNLPDDTNITIPEQPKRTQEQIIETLYGKA